MDAPDIGCATCSPSPKDASVETIYFNRFIRQCLVAFSLSVLFMLSNFFQWFPPLTLPMGQGIGILMGTLSLLVLFYAASDRYLGAVRALQTHVANMDTLIAMGTSAAWFFSMAVVLFPNYFPEHTRQLYFESALMIIAFIKLGSALELRSRGKTRHVIEQLTALQPKMACVVRHQEEFQVPVSEVVVGDVLHVRPGEQIPVDGVIVQGSSAVDESMFTGESIPTSKNVGDSVIGGTLNKNGSFTYRTLHVGKDTALAHVVELISQAQRTKLPIAKLADIIASYFVPTVIVIAILSALIWYHFGPEPKLMYLIIIPATVLLIACPCAMGLATPLAVMEGVGRAAERGILIRHGEAFGKIRTLTTIVLDKTGTITVGKPQITTVYPTKGWSKHKIIQYVASAEKNSEHPLAEAFLQEAQKEGLAFLPIDRFNAIPGYGLSGVIEGKSIVLGNARLMRERNMMEDTSISIEEGSALAQGQTLLYLAVDNKIVGAITASDKIKPDSKEAIARLKARGLKVIMLSGDHEKTAQAVARQVDIQEVIANVLPHEKMHKIAQLRRQGEKVAMVGDGINDAPALAEADVGFAVGTGTDVAMESGDIILMRNSLSAVIDALDLSLATDWNIKENLFGAFIYNMISIPVAAGILYPVWNVLLSPMIAGLAMALSSLTVVLNASRLRFK